MLTCHCPRSQAYINSFNAAMDKFLTAEARGDVSTMISLEAALRVRSHASPHGLARAVA